MMKCKEAVFFGSEKRGCIEEVPHTRHSAEYQGKLVTWTTDPDELTEVQETVQPADTGNVVESKEGTPITRFGRGSY